MTVDHGTEADTYGRFDEAETYFTKLALRGPEKRKRFMADLVISADSHVVEPFDLWVKALGAQYGDRVPHLVKSFDGRPGNYFYCGREAALVEELVSTNEKDRAEDLVRAGRDPAFRLKLIDADGVAAEVVNSTWTLYAMRIEDGRLRRACCSVFNDWITEYCSQDLKRLIGVAMVPVDDVEWGIAEMQRVARKGLRGVMIATQPLEGARPYRDRTYDRFWAAAQEMDMPVAIHIVTGRVRDPFTYHGEEERGEVPRSFIELFAEAAPVLANEFIFGGIFDRFPRLKLIASEYEASWIPHFRFRLDRIERFPGLAPLKKRARDYLRENIYLGIVNDPLAADMRHEIGVDRIMWGSDFPHPPCTYPNTHKILDRILAGVPADERHKIVAGNVMSLYNIRL